MRRIKAGLDESPVHEMNS